MIEAVFILGLFAFLVALILFLFGPHFFTSQHKIPPEDVTIWNRLNTDYSKADCGCVYKDGLRRYKPDTELVTGDLSESNTYWKKSQKGAKEEYRLYVEKLHRCTNCGNFVFEKEKKEGPFKIWPEEPLPDDVSESNHEIRET